MPGLPEKQSRNKEARLFNDKMKTSQESSDHKFLMSRRFKERTRKILTEVIIANLLKIKVKASAYSRKSLMKFIWLGFADRVVQKI